MRILYALDSYRPNIDGVGISIERQACGLVALGHQAAFVAPSPGLSDYEEQQDGVRVLRVRTAQFIRSHWRLAIVPSDLIDNAFDDYRPDVAVVSLPFPLSLRVSRAARQRDVPLVGITGTMPEWLLYNLGPLKPVLAGLYDRLWEAIAAFYNRCDVVVGVTATALRYLRLHGLCRPTRVISNGVDLTTFRPRPHDAALAAKLRLPEKPTVLYTGRLDPEKRLDVVLRAVPLVLDRINAHFVVGGEGADKPRLIAEAIRLGVQDNVSFVGFLSNEDYPAVYSLADVFVIASPAELQSIVTLEAAASGLPIVAANAGALPELVHHGRNGYLFPDGDGEQLAEYVSILLRDPERARWMGTQSRAVAQQHDIVRSIAQYEQLYQTVMAARPGAPQAKSQALRAPRLHSRPPRRRAS